MMVYEMLILKRQSFWRDLIDVSCHDNTMQDCKSCHHWSYMWRKTQQSLLVTLKHLVMEGVGFSKSQYISLNQTWNISNIVKMFPLLSNIQKVRLQFFWWHSFTKLAKCNCLFSSQSIILICCSIIYFKYCLCITAN